MLIELRKYLRRRKSLSGVYKRATLSALKLCWHRIKFPNRKFVVISLYEHIGDIISCEPVIGYVANQHKNCYIIWAVATPYAELLEAHPKVDYILPLESFSEWIILRRFLTTLPLVNKVIDLNLNGKKCSKYKLMLSKPGNGITTENYLYNKSLLEAFSTAAGLPALTDAPTFYLNKRKDVKTLPGHYVVLHTSSNHYMKDWPASKWTKLCGALIDEGFSVIEVGLEKQIDIYNDRYKDYTGPKSLQSIANIISSCSFFIGVESGFAHMANALNKGGLVLIGQYKIGKKTFDSYNPYTGKYRDKKHLISSEDNTVQSIGYETVVERMREMIMIKA